MVRLRIIDIGKVSKLGHFFADGPGEIARAGNLPDNQMGALVIAQRQIEPRFIPRRSEEAWLAGHDLHVLKLAEIPLLTMEAQPATADGHNMRRAVERRTQGNQEHSATQEVGSADQQHDR
jgi:hypothetical protein